MVSTCRFACEPHVLLEAIETGPSGDIAIAADAGAIWPMKRAGVRNFT